MPMRMKAHEYTLCLCDGILKYCIRRMLGKKQRQTLFKFCDITSKLCAEQIIKLQIELLETELHEVMALLKRDFPVSLQVIVFHLMHHLPMFLKRFGPVYSFGCILWNGLIHGSARELLTDAIQKQLSLKRTTYLNGLTFSRLPASSLMEPQPFLTLKGTHHHILVSQQLHQMSAALFN